MKYMLISYDDEQYWQQAGEAGMTAAMNEVVTTLDELKAKNQLIDCSPLEPSKHTAKVQVRDGKPIVTDGPYAETREVLGGYYVIDVPNLDDAIRVAARHPGARAGAVEIRPMIEIPNLPNA